HRGLPRPRGHDRPDERRARHHPRRPGPRLGPQGAAEPRARLRLARVGRPRARPLVPRRLMPGLSGPGEAIVLATLPNLRDAGGWPTADGRRVRTGVLFRSTALDRLDEADADAVVALGIRSVVDFRTSLERESQP